MNVLLKTNTSFKYIFWQLTIFKRYSNILSNFQIFKLRRKEFLKEKKAFSSSVNFKRVT